MIFNFLKYIHPIWYYNLRPKIDYSYFPKETTLIHQGYCIEKDLLYKSLEAQERDLGWRAFQQGFINIEESEGVDIWNSVVLPLEDEYRFFRKNFNKIWSVYVLLIRLMTLHNPIKEFHCFWLTRNVIRENYTREKFSVPEFADFVSPLISNRVLVSVIIPTLNRYEYLAAVLKDFEQQTYKHFEVIVVDQSEEFQSNFYNDWNLDIKFWFQEEKALWKARNEAIKFAKGSFILMSEDDIRIPKDLIENHLKTIDFFKADVSCGVFFPEGSLIPKERNFFKYGEQFATGNALLARYLFTDIGLFDRQFEKQRMGDAEFGIRLYLNGYKLISNPLAYCIDVKAPEGGLRVAGGSWDALRPKNFFAPRPIPSGLYFFRKYFGKKSAFNEGLKMALFSYVPYKFKRDNKMRIIYIMVTILFLWPFLTIAFIASWNKSSKMLKCASKIELL